MNHMKATRLKTPYIDFYRAHNLLDGENVYTRLYIREHQTAVIINSFKELYHAPED